MLVHAYYLRDARVRRYAEALAGANYEVDVFCLRDEGEEARGNYNGIRVVRIPFTRSRGGKWSYYWEYASAFLLFGLYLSVFTLWRRYSVVHVNTPPDALIFTTAVSLICGARIILDFHDLMPELYKAKYNLDGDNREIRILKLIEKRSARLADKVLTACSAFKRNLISRSVREDKVQIIRNLPDTRLFRSRRGSFVKESSSFTLLYIGTISERYGVDIPIKALPELRIRIPQIRLRIVGKISGEGAYRYYLTDLAVRLGVSDIVSFGPPIPLDEVAEQMGLCDVGVYTPHRDIHMDHAFSLKVGEFAAMNVPMVTTRTPVMLEFLGEDGASYIESGDVRGFVGQVCRLYSDPDYRSAVLNASDEFTLRNDWDSEKTLYLEIVRDMGPARKREVVPGTMRAVAKRAARTIVPAVHRWSNNLLPVSPDAQDQGVRILTYHDVGGVEGDQWSVSAADFAEQMRVLADYGPVVSLDDVLSWIAGESKLPDHAIALTFDDGYEGVYRHAMPSIERYGMPATVFVVETFQRLGRTPNGKSCLTLEQIQIMAKAGIGFGSHGRSHVSLGASELDDDSLWEEVVGSKINLERMLSMPIPHFAYPYGTGRDVNQRVVAAVQRARYGLGLTSIHGKVELRSEPFRLRRIKVERTDSLATFREVLRGGLDQWAWIDQHLSWLQSPRSVAKTRA